jgi:3-hydroxyisobutyrate dehydrogenase-like beta-hydroxyacid dehydrogenase
VFTSSATLVVASCTLGRVEALGLMNSLEWILKRDRWMVAIALVLVGALAWGYTLAGAGMGMSAFEMTRHVSGSMDQKGNKMVTEDFAPEARLSQHLKDVGLILDMGMKQGMKLPISALHAEVLRSGVEAGYGDQDNSAAIRALEHYIGLK